MSETPQPAASARLTAPSKRVKTIDSYRYCPVPFFDVVPLCAGELTAQIMSKEDSQIAASVDQELVFCNVVFLDEPM